jgi:hypothetical protein
LDLALAMVKTDAEEAFGGAVLTLNAILDVTPTKGRPGADLRTAIGDFTTFGLELIQYDQSGPRIADIFELARRNGISLAELSYVRTTAFNQEPVTAGGVLYRNSLVHLSLATEADIIANTEFKSRNAAEAMKDQMNDAFDAMEEQAADSMDSATYRALVTLHAAVTEYCVTAQYPLPVMLNFRFAQAGPTLVFAYKLYDDASRADQLKEENSVIHPMFMLNFGRALSE